MVFRCHHVFILFLLSFSLTAWSESQSAHTHGIASLSMALENEALEIEFESPAANLVGFEHKAHSKEEKKAVIQAESILKKAEKIFSFAGGTCQVNEVLVDVSGVLDEKKEEKHDDHHGHHDHSDEHGESGHSEITAHYRFSCKAPKKLTSVSVALFAHFPGLEKIDAMWITESKQGAASLTATKHTVGLR